MDYVAILAYGFGITIILHIVHGSFFSFKRESPLVNHTTLPKQINKNEHEYKRTKREVGHVNLVGQKRNLHRKNRLFLSSESKNSRRIITPEIEKRWKISIDQLRAEHEHKGILFEDSEFPASNNILPKQSHHAIWLRPQEIIDNLNIKRWATMFVHGHDRFDINQGRLGDCWFLASLANLSQSEPYFRVVVPSHQNLDELMDYVGMFTFRFWNFGKWIEIRIDDRLPVDPKSGELLYLRSTVKHEFWGALLEKAYAKFLGSYELLEGGVMNNSAVNFTGGIPETIDVTSTEMSSSQLFYILYKAYDCGSFIGAQIQTGNTKILREAERLGLIKEHAYTITKLINIKLKNGSKGIRLIRIRNPHGDYHEWRGPWSDGHETWQSLFEMLETVEMKKKLIIKEQLQKLKFDDDGEFYMSFRHFIKYFGKIEICHLTSDAPNTMSHSNNFELLEYKGTWTRNVSAGGCGNSGAFDFLINPQIYVEFSDSNPYDKYKKCPVLISLAQKRNAKTEFAIGFEVYRCDRIRKLDIEYLMSHKPVMKTDNLLEAREVSKRFDFPTGRYCIIPYTFYKNQEAKFMVRILVEKSWHFISSLEI